MTFPLITLKVEDLSALTSLARVATIAGGAPRLMREIAGIMHTEVEDNFAAQGRPHWMPLKPSTLLSKYRRDLTTSKGNARRDGGARFRNAVSQNKILHGRRKLASSVVMQSSAWQAIVGSNKIYAAIHQLGGKTKPHDIRPRRKKALAFGGIVRKLVHHPGSNIPARPFLTLGPDGGRRIESAAARYLQGLIK